MVQHVTMDGTQMRARLDPHLVEEQPSSTAVVVEGCRLVACAVVRDHELTPSPLPQSVARQGLLDHGHQLAALTQRHPRGNEIIGGVLPQRLQAPGLGVTPLQIGVALVCATRPLCQRALCVALRLEVVPDAQRGSRAAGAQLEPLGIDRPGQDVQPPCAAEGPEQGPAPPLVGRLEHTAQPRHVGCQRAPCARWRRPGPQLLDDLIAGHGRAGRCQEKGEELALPSAGHPHRLPHRAASRHPVGALPSRADLAFQCQWT